MLRIWTIGYEGTTAARFADALRTAGVELLVDVRAVASSRRPGFAKSRLAAHVEEVGIRYLHLRDLGTPSDGRAAARAGRHDEMRRVFREHLATERARDALDQLAEIVRGGTRACLLCFEAEPAHCHRSLVVEALGAQLPALDVVHLMVEREVD